MTRFRSNSPCPYEFKVEAVRLFRESGKSLRAMADELVVSTNSLREWSRQLDIEKGVRPGLNDEERGELRRLRRENKVLREEGEILKKAAGFFTGRPGPGSGVPVH